MDKFKGSEIKPFVFSDLKGSHVVEQAGARDFVFQDLDGRVVKKTAPTEEVIRQERTFEKKSSFKIDSAVREHRGLSAQEDSDFERRVQAEVEARVQQIQQKAYEAGFEKGQQDGAEQVHHESSDQFEALSEQMKEMFVSATAQVDQFTLNHKNEMMKFVKNFAKWVLYKEINEKDYLSHLLEKLLHELNARRNLVIRVNESSYEFMPDIIASLDKKLGGFSNLRLEVSNDIHYPGLIVESENGIMDGSLENIFSKLDHFFEQAGHGE